MFCQKCGNQLRENANFCNSCGQAVLNETIKNEIISNLNPKPWRRFWARWIDIMLFSIFGGLLLYSFDFIYSTNEIVLGLIILAAYVFVEAITLSIFGTTFGKWLLSIKITKEDNTRLTFVEALNRSFVVYIAGLGLGIPILSLITLVSSYSELKKDKITRWDKKGHFVVVMEKVSVIHSILVVILILAILVLVGLAGE